VRVERADPEAAEGWHVGPWNSDLDVSVGFANEGVDESHVHRRVTGIYLAARGTAVIRVGHENIELHPGDVSVVEPGEAHILLSNSSNYLHFVRHVPGLTGIEEREDKGGSVRYGSARYGSARGGSARYGSGRGRRGLQSPPRSHQTT
jgi:mannose-6-phosphate isomerase-like protein (cupin superfamily)